MTDLQECRKEIYIIDKEILRLFEKRMKVCENVAEYKIHTGKYWILKGNRIKSRFLRILRMVNLMNLVHRNCFSRSWRSAANVSISS